MNHYTIHILSHFSRVKSEHHSHETSGLFSFHIYKILRISSPVIGLLANDRVLLGAGKVVPSDLALHHLHGQAHLHLEESGGCALRVT